MRIQERVEYHCETEEIAKAFLLLVERQGFLWRSGDKPTDFTNWTVNEEETCYSVGLFGHHSLGYGNIHNIDYSVSIELVDARSILNSDHKKGYPFLISI